MLKGRADVMRDDVRRMQLFIKSLNVQSVQ